MVAGANSERYTGITSDEIPEIDVRRCHDNHWTAWVTNQLPDHQEIGHPLAKLVSMCRLPLSQSNELISGMDPLANTCMKPDAMKMMFDTMIDHFRPNVCVKGSWSAAPKKLPPWNKDTKFALISSLSDLLIESIPKSRMKLSRAIVPPKNPVSYPGSAIRIGTTVLFRSYNSP